MLYLLFQLGNDRYALEARRVVEVAPLLALKRMPQAPRGVAGMVVYRGRALPALDLCELTLDRPARERLSTRIIIVQCDESRVTSEPPATLTPPGTRHPPLLGLIAERATGMMRREAGDFVDAGARPATAPFLGPVLVDERGVIQLLHAQELLAGPLRDLVFAPEMNSK